METFSTLWLHFLDDVPESPFLSVFLRVIILQVPFSASEKETLEVTVPRFPYAQGCMRKFIADAV